MQLNKFLNSDILSHTREDENWRMIRLYKLLGYLAGTLTPTDLECIVSLHDHKGDLEVTLSEKKVNKLAEITPSYSEYLKEKLQKAWEELGEVTVNIEFQSI